MEESDFYQFFASFELLEKQYFVTMFAYTLELLEKMKLIIRMKVPINYQLFILLFSKWQQPTEALLCIY